MLLCQDGGHAAAPGGGLRNAEEMKDGGGDVVLHHGLLDLSCGEDAGACEDEGGFGFVGGDASMAFVDAAVVGGDDEDGAVGKAGVCHGLDDAADIAVDIMETGHILGGVVAIGMAYMIDLVEDDGGQRGMGGGDVVDSLVAELRGLLHVGLLVMVDGEGVGEALDGVPLVETAYLGVGLVLTEQREERGGDAVGIGGDAGQFGRGRTPGGVAVELYADAHEHGAPVHGAAGGDDAALVERPAAGVHQGTDMGDVGTVHAGGVPPVDADEDDVGVTDDGLVGCTAHKKAGQKEED